MFTSVRAFCCRIFLHLISNKQRCETARDLLMLAIVALAIPLGLVYVNARHTSLDATLGHHNPSKDMPTIAAHVVS